MEQSDAMIGWCAGLFDGEGNELERKTVGEDASFEFNIGCKMEYIVRGEKETYTSDEKRFTTPSRKQELKLQLLLFPFCFLIAYNGFV